MPSRSTTAARGRSPRRRAADPRPSTLNRYLLDSERLVFAVRRHVTVLAGATSVYALLLLVAGLLLGFANGVPAIATAGLIVLLAASAWYGWKVGDWWVERFTVTDRRVLLVSGLLTRRVAIMPLRKVTDLTFERSLGGRLFGYGAFVMESAGQQQALSRVDFLPRPESLYLQMSDLLFGTGNGDEDPDEDGSSTSRRRRRPTRPRREDRSARPGRAPESRHRDDDVPSAFVTTTASDGWGTGGMPLPDDVEPRRPVRAPVQPQVRSTGSPAAATTTAPLPAIARERPVARRPRGRLDEDR